MLKYKLQNTCKCFCPNFHFVLILTPPFSSHSLLPVSLTNEIQTTDADLQHTVKKPKQHNDSTMYTFNIPLKKPLNSTHT